MEGAKYLIKLPKEVSEFIKSHGNAYHGEVCAYNLPQWFIETEKEDIYEIVLPENFPGGLREWVNRIEK